MNRATVLSPNSAATLADLQGRQVLVVGLGESGLAMARWCVTRGAEVRVVDSRVAPPMRDALAAALPGVVCHLGGFDVDAFAGIDLIALSPGVARNTPAIAAAEAAGMPVTGELGLFVAALDALPQRPKLIAITGTNGKTTTTALTGELLKAAGLDVQVAGNISPAMLDAWMAREAAGQSQPDAWVLELSSFQLEAAPALNADGAALLNVSDDHLDRYPSLEAYAQAKARIVEGARCVVVPDAPLFCQIPAGAERFGHGLAGDWRIAEQDGVPWLWQGDEALLPQGALKLAGRHNAENALAALALVRAAGVAVRDVLPALREFKGLPHRVSWVRRFGGVDFYDDSKGTNVGATLAALQGMGRKVIVLLGGDGKGQDFSPLAPALAEHARAAVLFGRDGLRIGEAVAGCGVPLLAARDMVEAVRLAFAQTRPGDVVLLSPACASLDMFRSYVHRAEVFVGAVRQLVAEAGED